MKAIVTGATGFIGKALTEALIARGDTVVALTRDLVKGRKSLGDGPVLAQWDGRSAAGWGEQVESADAIVNLAGENISAGRWSQTQKEKILNSRLDAGKAVFEAIRSAKNKPKVLVQASGIGYYGTDSNMHAIESTPAGEGFLAFVSKQWEPSTAGVEEFGVRRVILRTAAVLGKNGGALPKMLLPYKLFMGGPVGNGRQWFPWIHLDDEIGAILHLLDHENLSGPFNLCAPETLQMKVFSSELGKALKRPSWLPVPGFALKLALGEMAEELLLGGQRAIPKALLDSGYRFKFGDVRSALTDLLG